METIDPELLMTHACQVYKRKHQHIDFRVTNAATSGGTLHFGVAIRSKYLTNQMIDELLEACRMSKTASQYERQRLIHDAKKLESEVDAAVEHVLNPKPQQAELFPT